MTFRMIALAGVSAMIAAPALAQDDRFQPIQSSDALYTCEQLQQEAAVMEDELGIAEGSINDVQAMNTAIGLGTDLAIRAGGSGAASVLGGLGGLGGLARGAMEQQRQASEARKEQAQDRWYYLAGLYMGKACDQPPAPPPAPVGAEAPAPLAGPQPVPAEAPAAGPALPAPGEAQ